MDGWRQWRTGRGKNLVQRKQEKPKKTYLAATGLLMEGDYTQEKLERLIAVVVEQYEQANRYHTEQSGKKNPVPNFAGRYHPSCLMPDGLRRVLTDVRFRSSTFLGQKN
jgi:hypothetical protein